MQFSGPSPLPCKTLPLRNMPRTLSPSTPLPILLPMLTTSHSTPAPSTICQGGGGNQGGVTVTVVRGNTAAITQTDIVYRTTHLSGTVWVGYVTSRKVTSHKSKPKANLGTTDKPSTQRYRTPPAQRHAGEPADGLDKTSCGRLPRRHAPQLEHVAAWEAFLSMPPLQRNFAWIPGCRGAMRGQWGECIEKFITSSDGRRRGFLFKFPGLSCR